MKKLWIVVAMLAVALVGCDKGSPTDVTETATVDNAAYSVQSMFKSVGVADASAIADSGVCAHDSLRNVRMLDTLKVYLSLTDDQYAQVVLFGEQLHATLKAIKESAKAGVVSRDSARTLVQAARDQFIASVNAILTADQQALFATWQTQFWEKGKGREGKHGRGGAMGPDGHGGRGPGGHGKH